MLVIKTLALIAIVGFGPVLATVVVAAVVVAAVVVTIGVRQEDRYSTLKHRTAPSRSARLARVILGVSVRKYDDAETVPDGHPDAVLPRHALHSQRRVVAAITVVAAMFACVVGPLLLGLVAPSPAKAATMITPGPSPVDPAAQTPAHIHTVVVGGMPGWQIMLIAAGSAVLAAILAVAADRARATRRHVPAPPY